jgi:hypothetical protein
VRWVGIDEAGYGPNLGPMVMTAVVAEATTNGSSEPARPVAFDFWRDLAATVDRAGGDPERLWIDDSKAIYRGGKGRDRLELACLAAVHAAAGALPRSFLELLEALGVDPVTEAELSPWFDGFLGGGSWPALGSREDAERLHRARPFGPPCGTWRIRSVRSVVLAPARFNQGLEEHGLKSAVHFDSFVRLLAPLWDLAADGVATYVCGDKHGGRHFYLPALSRSFPGAWIDRGPEGPELSRYVIRAADRRLELALAPRAEASHGLVALASIVSKAVRELWMDAFNAFWCARVPGLRPTAGYYTDAHRFRREIEPAASVEPRLDPSVWWRRK